MFQFKNFLDHYLSDSQMPADIFWFVYSLVLLWHILLNFISVLTNNTYVDLKGNFDTTAKTDMFSVISIYA
jgi:hypothetical protein